MSHQLKKRLKAIQKLMSLHIKARVRYDMVANHMQFLGYTDFEIYFEQGPRP